MSVQSTNKIKNIGKVAIRTGEIFMVIGECRQRLRALVARGKMMLLLII